MIYVFFLNIKNIVDAKKGKENKWYKYENESNGSHQ